MADLMMVVVGGKEKRNYSRTPKGWVQSAGEGARSSLSVGRCALAGEPHLGRAPQCLLCDVRGARELHWAPLVKHDGSERILKPKQEQLAHGPSLWGLGRLEAAFLHTPPPLEARRCQSVSHTPPQKVPGFPPSRLAVDLMRCEKEERNLHLR